MRETILALLREYDKRGPGESLNPGSYYVRRGEAEVAWFTILKSKNKRYSSSKFQILKICVLVSSGIELIFFPVAAVVWIQYEKNVGNTGVCSCC